MCAEDGLGRVLTVRRARIARRLDHGLRVVADLVPAEAQRKVARAAGIGLHLALVAHQLGHGRASGQHGASALCERRVEHAGEFLHIGHQPAQVGGRQVGPEIVHRFEQQALGLFQALAHGPGAPPRGSRRRSCA